MPRVRTRTAPVRTRTRFKKEDSPSLAKGSKPKPQQTEEDSTGRKGESSFLPSKETDDVIGGRPVAKGCWNCQHGDLPLDRKCYNCMMAMKTFLPAWKKMPGTKLEARISHTPKAILPWGDPFRKSETRIRTRRA